MNWFDVVQDTGTTWHYRVLSKDAAGNQAASGDFTFPTQSYNATNYWVDLVFASAP